MKNLMVWLKKKWWNFKHSFKYTDAIEKAEYFQNENERMDDNVIRRLNELDTKVDAILFAVNCLLHSETNGNDQIPKKKTKVDKLVEKDTKVENKGKRREKPKKEKD